MPTTYMQHTLQANTRADVRSELVTLLLQEQPGTGAGVNASRYRYTVDTFNNYSIVLNSTRHDRCERGEARSRCPRFGRHRYG